MAWPLSVPRNQVTRIAGASATAPASASARPLLSSTTIGLPVAATASASCCCGSGTTTSVRDCASPDMLSASPIARTTMSAARAAATALSISPASGSSIPEPVATMIAGLAAGRGAHRCREIDRAVVVTISDPWADEVVALGERADQRDRLASLGQRQQIAVILQHDDRLAGRFPRQSAAGGEQSARGFALLVDAAEWIVEQAEHGLDRQHFAHRLVEQGFRHIALANEVGQEFAIKSALHAHVDAGEEREPRGVARIPGEAVRDHFLVAGVIGHDKALETPFIAQQLGLEPVIAGGRNAGNLVERRHSGHRASRRTRLGTAGDRPRAASARTRRPCCSRARLAPRHRPRNA